MLPRPALFGVFTSLIQSYLDYGDIIYDQAYNASFKNKLKSIRYNADLAILGIIKRSFSEKFFGLRIISFRTKVQRSEFYKIIKNKTPKHLFNVMHFSKNILAKENEKIETHVICHAPN